MSVTSHIQQFSQSHYHLVANRWHYLAAVIATLLSLTTITGHAAPSFSIMVAPEKPIVGKSNSIFLNWRNPDAAARVTILVLEPGSRNWNILTHNADRAGTIPQVHWTPRRTGTHTVRVDIAAPNQREVRKTKKVEVVEDRVTLATMGGVPALGRSIILTPTFTSGRANRDLVFSVKFDTSNRWRTINGGRDGDTIRWFPAQAGAAELRVRAIGGAGTIEGFTRVLVREKPQPVRMTGRGFASGDFPEFKNLITLDSSRGRVGEARTVTVNLHREARAERRISIRYRHVARDRDWTVYRQNTDRLIFPWTPRFTGEYLLEAQIYKENGTPHYRQEIRFVAIP